jgi:hypothetical protein
MTRRDFVGLLCASAVARAQSDTLLAGFYELYHLRFAEGRAIFARWRAEHPADPMGAAAEAAAYLFEEFERHSVLTTDFFLNDDRLLGGIVGTADPVRTKLFEQAAAETVQLGEKATLANPKDANAWLALTLASGMRADFASLIAKRQVESLKQIRQAEAYGNRLLSIAPQMGDGYMALGAASYILACLPVYKRALLWVGGLQGNKQRGLEELERAARTGHYLAPYAKMMLALACLRERQPDRARTLVAELVAQFPQSSVFAREQARIAAWK